MNEPNTPAHDHQAPDSPREAKPACTARNHSLWVKLQDRNNPEEQSIPEKFNLSGPGDFDPALPGRPVRHEPEMVLGNLPSADRKRYPALTQRRQSCDQAPDQPRTNHQNRRQRAAAAVTLTITHSLPTLTPYQRPKRGRRRPL